MPISEENYNKIHNEDIRLADKVFKTIQENGTTPKQIECLNKMYDYLRVINLSDKFQNENWDVAIVPGCRSDFEFRVRRAYETYSLCGVRNIIITGMRPYYDDDNHEIHIAEAEAMHYVLEYKDVYDLKAIDIRLETRAKNTRENVVHCLPILQEIRNKSEKPIKVLLVTSPYHMRRYFCLVNKWLSNEENLFSSIGCATSSTYFEKNTWFKTSSSKKFNDDYGIRLYFQEYFKLIGGRASGEF